MFEHHFIVRGKDVGHHARHYVSGLLGRQERKNIEQIESDVADSDYQGMQQFISDSPWSHEALMRQVGEQADAQLGHHRDTGLYFDETSYVKKGDLSVGVQRQYCGRLGKTENCQVAVFACLGRGRHAALVDFRLFLPESWAQDDERCARAKVPPEHRAHHTKTELALQMLHAARERGSSHQWIGGDEVYGNNQILCAKLDELGETFLMDVARDTLVWDADPMPAPPAARPGVKPKGRPQTQAQRTNTEARRHKIAALVKDNFAQGNRKVTLRESTQGKLQSRLWVRQVWLWEAGAEAARRRLLVVRQEGDGTFKYSLSNAAPSTSWERLGYMQTQRFWIEQAFKEAKSELGMAHYEVRGWPGWHHHMALVCLAQLFTVRERIGVLDAAPLLSARDIAELLAFYLPRRPRDENEVLRQLTERHQRRAQAQRSHAKRRRKMNLNI